jgi:hypothetical protein
MLFVVNREHDWFLELVDVVWVIVYNFGAFHSPAWMFWVMTVFRSFFTNNLADGTSTLQLVLIAE